MKQNAIIQLRLSIEEKELIEKKAKEFGFASISEYLRYLGKNCQEINIVIDKKRDEGNDR